MTSSDQTHSTVLFTRREQRLRPGHRLGAARPGPATGCQRCRPGGRRPGRLVQVHVGGLSSDGRRAVAPHLG